MVKNIDRMAETYLPILNKVLRQHLLYYGRIVLLNYEFNRSELLDYIDTFTVQLGVYIGLIIFGGLPMLIYFLIRKNG